MSNLVYIVGFSVSIVNASFSVCGCGQAFGGFNSGSLGMLRLRHDGRVDHLSGSSERPLSLTFLVFEEYRGAFFYFRCVSGVGHCQVEDVVRLVGQDPDGFGFRHGHGANFENGARGLRVGHMPLSNRSSVRCRVFSVENVRGVVSVVGRHVLGISKASAIETKNN